MSEGFIETLQNYLEAYKNYQNLLYNDNSSEIIITKRLFKEILDTCEECLEFTLHLFRNKGSVDLSNKIGRKQTGNDSKGDITNYKFLSPTHQGEEKAFQMFSPIKEDHIPYVESLEDGQLANLVSEPIIGDGNMKNKISENEINNKDKDNDNEIDKFQAQIGSNYNDYLKNLKLNFDYTNLTNFSNFDTTNLNTNNHSNVDSSNWLYKKPIINHTTHYNHSNLEEFQTHSIPMDKHEVVHSNYLQGNILIQDHNNATEVGCSKDLKEKENSYAKEILAKDLETIQSGNKGLVKLEYVNDNNYGKNQDLELSNKNRNKATISSVSNQEIQSNIKSELFNDKKGYFKEKNTKPKYNFEELETENDNEPKTINNNNNNNHHYLRNNKPSLRSESPGQTHRLGLRQMIKSKSNSTIEYSEPQAMPYSYNKSQQDKHEPNSRNYSRPVSKNESI